MASDFLDHQPQMAPHLPVSQTTHTGAISGHLPDFPLPQPEVFGSTAWFLRTGVFSPNDPQSGELPLLPYEYESHRGMGPGPRTQASRLSNQWILNKGHLFLQIKQQSKY